MMNKIILITLIWQWFDAVGWAQEGHPAYKN